MNFIFSKHAIEQMRLRKISQDIIINILNTPDQILHADEQIEIYQSVINETQELKYLIRVFVNTEMKKIITVYKTSKIEKYYENKV